MQGKPPSNTQGGIAEFNRVGHVVPALVRRQGTPSLDQKGPKGCVGLTRTCSKSHPMAGGRAYEGRRVALVWLQLVHLCGQYLCRLTPDSFICLQRYPKRYTYTHMKSYNMRVQGDFTILFSCAFSLAFTFPLAFFPLFRHIVRL